MMTHYPEIPEVEEVCAQQDTYAHRRQVYQHQGANIIVLSHWLAEARKDTYDINLHTQHCDVYLRSLPREFLEALQTSLRVLLAPIPAQPTGPDTKL